MHINVRRVGGRWFLLQQGRPTPGAFKGLGEALHEAGLRFRQADRRGPASLSIVYGEPPEDGAAEPTLELAVGR